MNDHHEDNVRWAQESGYEFHAETQGAHSDGARSLDIFRKAESFRDHVLGISRNRPFEILDVQVREFNGGEWGFVWKTVILISTAGLDLPNFDLLPRRETGGMNFLGIKGLDLKVNPLAPPDERRLVEAFNKNYSLFAGGAFEAMEAAIKSADHLVPGLAEMDSICKPGVLRFLSTASTGTIELQNGFLAVCAPEIQRIISAPFNDTVLGGRDRESLLAVASDLLDVLSNAASEAPLRTLTLENTFKPAKFLSIIGTVIGLFLGGFVCLPVMFLLNGKHIFLIPVMILGGAALGRFIGKMLTRAR